MKSKAGKIAFIICVSALLALGAVAQIVIKDSNLQGETVKHESVNATFADFWSGKWQAAQEKYLEDNLKVREWLIPVRNQIMYSLFKTSPNGNIVIGKNNNLYEEEYICFETQIYSARTPEEIEELMGKLKAIDQAVRDAGKKFFIFITPSKAEIYYEDIPDRYLWIAPKQKEKSTYDRFMEELEKTGIAYYDSTVDVRALKQTEDFHVFPRTGTHWNNVTAAICAKNLADSMEEQLDINLPECEVSYQECEEPLHPDTDIFNALNLLEEPDEVFVEPIVEITDSDKEDYVILARGGSFMGASIGKLISYDYFLRSYYLENTYASCPEGVYSGNFDSYDVLPLEEMVDDSDIIFLEVNEEAIPRMSFGFIDYLLERHVLGKGEGK